MVGAREAGRGGSHPKGFARKKGLKLVYTTGCTVVYNSANVKSNFPPSAPTHHRNRRCHAHHITALPVAVMLLLLPSLLWWSLGWSLLSHRSWGSQRRGRYCDSGLVANVVAFVVVIVAVVAITFVARIASSALLCGGCNVVGLLSSLTR